jgi:glycosyltransferase involved in cell wall biosynthesis
MKNILPRISIVTPSFNQGKFIEQTIKSVLSQGYPNLEYIIIDGGSTDNSINIIKKYEDKLAFWVSAPDSGQANAINRGLRRSEGEILKWINSDDYLLPGSLFIAAKAFNEGNDRLGVVYGFCHMIERGGELFEERKCINFNAGVLRYGQNLFAQPASFFHRRVINRIGFLNEDLTYAMDYEYWIRAYEAGFMFKAIDIPLAAFRFHGHSKTVRRQSLMKNECDQITLEKVLRLKKSKSNLLITRVIISLFRLKNFFLRGVEHNQWNFGSITRAKKQGRFG